MRATKLNNDGANTTRRLGVAGWIAIIILGGFLGASAAYAIYAWNAMAGVGISAAGWVFMMLGVVLTIMVGGGLMALVFYSSRKNYDR